MKYSGVLISIFAVSILLFGCDTESLEQPIDKAGNTSTETSKREEIKNQTPDSPYANVVTIDTNQENPTVRARIDTGNGELYVISEGKEAIGHVTIPSVLGKEGDFFYQSNYSVIYKHNEDKKEIKELQDLVFIQPSDQPISFEKISFDAIDVFLLTPEYTSSRGYNSYAFGIDKTSEDAFSITFKNAEKVQDSINYEKVSTPANKNEKLIVTTRNTEGQGDTLTTEYSFNKDSKQFVAE